MTEPEAVELAGVLARADRLAVAGRRTLLGITGPPGAGKTVLAEALTAHLGARVAVVPMDGFHLAQAQLDRLGLAQVKGAPETFDGWGYRALVRRLRDADEPVVHAPRFDRGLEEPIGSAIPVPVDVPLVVTEGNYLLLPTEPWRGVRALCDEVWSLEPGEERRLRWLVRRHRAYGRDEQTAYGRALGSDERNADLVRSGAASADWRISLPDDPLADART